MPPMAEPLASWLVVVLMALAIGMLLAAFVQSRRANVTARAKLLWNVVAWLGVMLASAAVWMIATGQISK